MARYLNKNKAHRRRIITAAIGLPIVFYILLFAPYLVFSLFVLAIGAISAYEHYSLWGLKSKKFLFWGHVFLSACLILYFAFDSYHLTGLNLFVLISSLYFILIYRYTPQQLSLLPICIFGLIYPNIFLAHAFLIRALPKGEIWLFWILLTVFASDTGAFYVGNLFGRHKLYEQLSPGKTWEGGIGGILSAILLGFIGLIWLPISLEKILFLSLIIAISGQIGDLFESAIKRHARCKDSGHILPGHGGMLDRIDALLFVLPVVYYILLWMR